MPPPPSSRRRSPSRSRPCRTRRRRCRGSARARPRARGSRRWLPGRAAARRPGSQIARGLRELSSSCFARIAIDCVQVLVDREAVARERDRGLDELLPRLLAELLVQPQSPATEPGTPDAPVRRSATRRVGLPSLSRYMSAVAAAGATSRKSSATALPAATRTTANPPPPRLPGGGVHDGERERGGDRGVDRVAARREDGLADLGRGLGLRHDHERLAGAADRGVRMVPGLGRPVDRDRAGVGCDRDGAAGAAGGCSRCRGWPGPAAAGPCANKPRRRARRQSGVRTSWADLRYRNR